MTVLDVISQLRDAIRAKAATTVSRSALLAVKQENVDLKAALAQSEAEKAEALANDVAQADAIAFAQSTAAEKQSEADDAKAELEALKASEAGQDAAAAQADAELESAVKSLLEEVSSQPTE